MLQNLFYIIYVSIVCMIWGAPLMMAVQKKPWGTLCFFSGLVIISLISSWLVLFMPLGDGILLILTGCLLIIELTWLRKKILAHFSGIQWNIPFILFLCASLMFIFLGSGQPVMEDTSLYHIQLVRWNQQYGTVPGLANLYLRDGFYSNWFHLISLFALPFKQQNFLFLNITVCIWFFYFLIQKIRTHISQHSILSILYFLIAAYMLFEWDLTRGNASSTSYDFIVTALTLLVLLMITENLLLPAENKYPLHIIILFALATPFFKISGASALVLLFVYFLISRQAVKKYFVAAGIFILFLFPYLAKNYIQTGYPFYPYTFLSNLSTPDWQVPPALLSRFTGYMNLSNKYINIEIPESAWHNTSLNWMAVWVKTLTWPDKCLLVLVFLNVIVSFFLPLLRNIKILYYTSLLLLLPWFFSSPDPRFAYGIILFVAFLPMSYLLAGILKKRWIEAGLVIMIIACIAYVSMNTKKLHSDNVVQTPAIIHPPYSKVSLRSFPLFLPELINDNWNIRCYDTPLPCVYEVNPYLEARGNTIKDGFRMKPVDSTFILHYIY